MTTSTAMIYLKTLVPFSVFYVSLEFIADFLGVGSANLIAVMALYLACRADLRIEELEERP